MCAPRNTLLGAEPRDDQRGAGFVWVLQTLGLSMFNTNSNPPAKL